MTATFYIILYNSWYSGTSNIIYSAGITFEQPREDGRWANDIQWHDDYDIWRGLVQDNPVHTAVQLHCLW